MVGAEATTERYFFRRDPFIGRGVLCQSPLPADGCPLGVSFHVTSALQSQSGARHESRQCRYDGYIR